MGVSLKGPQGGAWLPRVGGEQEGCQAQATGATRSSSVMVALPPRPHWYNHGDPALGLGRQPFWSQVIDAILGNCDWEMSWSPEGMWSLHLSPAQTMA